MKPRDMNRDQAIEWIWQAWFTYDFLNQEEMRTYIGWINDEKEHLRGMAHAMLLAYLFPDKYTAHITAQKLKGDL